MGDRRDMLSQTIRFDIPPDLLKMPTAKREGKIVGPAPPPVTPQAPNPAAGLVELDSNFHELFQHVYDGALIVDLSGRIIDANQRACEFLLYERADFQSLPITTLISGSDGKLMEALRSNLEKAQFTLIQAYCARKDQTLFPAEIAVNRLKLARQDYYCFFIRDVSIRRQHEELLRTEHNAIQNSSNGIGMATLAAQLEYVNPAVVQMWGYDKTEEIIGRNMVDLLADASLVEKMMEAIKSGKTWSGRTQAKRKDQSTFHVQISIAGTRDSDDELVGMVISFLDISANLRAEEAERQAERQQVMMESLGTACHHLGQPATVIVACIDVLRKLPVAEQDETVKDLLAASMEAAESLRAMLHELNDMTEYKTKPYLESQDGSAFGGTRILDF